jgi:hypothetical protein
VSVAAASASLSWPRSIQLDPFPSRRQTIVNTFDLASGLDDELMRLISAKFSVTSQTGFAKSPVSLRTVFAHRSSALSVQAAWTLGTSKSGQSQSILSCRGVAEANENKKMSNWRAARSY